MIIIFLTAGLFLGWSLGANDAANVFGTAVGTRMLRFYTAAVIAGIFVIIGSVVQGAGTTATLGQLGAVNTMAGAFTVALSSALTVYFMTRYALPVSTSQAIVGGIIGWNLFTGLHTDLHTLAKITSSWVASPLLGAIFSILLYLLVKWITTRTRIHLIRLDAWIRYGLVIAGAFGAYSLGANNIANVMGVYVSAMHLNDMVIGGRTILSGTQQLFLIGGIAIAVGVVSYSRRTMQTVGRNLMKLSAEAAIVVVLAQALVLFVFSSQWLQGVMTSVGLPAIPMVPVSSSHATIGAIIGIGLLKGGRGVSFKIFGQVALGWVATPLIAMILAFFLLFVMNNVFNQPVFR